MFPTHMPMLDPAHHVTSGNFTPPSGSPPPAHVPVRRGWSLFPALTGWCVPSEVPQLHTIAFRIVEPGKASIGIRLAIHSGLRVLGRPGQHEMLQAQNVLPSFLSHNADPRFPEPP